MYNLSKKQKIIIIILVGILLLVFCYYIYSNDKDSIIENTLEENSVNEIQEIEKNIEEPSESTIMVHISGAVAKEGIVELKSNSRIADAIEKAGGLTEDADMSKVNLAFMLEDGIKIYIPRVNEKNTNEQTEVITKSSGLEIIQNNVSTPTTKQTKVNINAATQETLETLPGIGPSTASKILQYRKEKGRFNSIEEIQEVSGIGESKYNKIKDLITVK